MDQMLEENHIVLTGRLLEMPQFSHRTFGESFYRMLLGVERQSGYEDRIPVIASGKLLGALPAEAGAMVRVMGQVRTYNQKTGGRNHLVIVCFAREAEAADLEAPMENTVRLEGFVCKETIRRTSPLGREICDIMVAVNRPYNKSDYIPCIAWGRNAVFAGELAVGDSLYLEGRLQSRNYRKYDEEGNVTVKTAYEVSIMVMDTPCQQADELLQYDG